MSSVSLCKALKKKYLQIVSQSLQNLSGAEYPSSPTHLTNNLQSKTNSFSVNACKNPNRNLIKIRNWNTDIKFEEEQLFFLKLFQKNFLNLDIWYSNLHEVNLTRWSSEKKRTQSTRRTTWTC